MNTYFKAIGCAFNDVEPERYIKDFKNVGANILTVHIEASKHLHRTLQAIKARRHEGRRCG